jgi:non-specific serine/threonine protein kinase/serine/threonine-protein kinase
VEARAVIGMVGSRYRLSGLLGEGGMARVFDAFDERLERPVAVKILRPETEALPGMRTRFQQEARISARLVHPNIVAVLDYGEDGAGSYLVMERLPGQTLRDEITRGPIAPARLVVLMSETLAALAAAHKCGVLHRDVKPSNILLDEDGHAKITDFGIAKSFDARPGSDPTADLTMTGVVLGTPGYLAPERRVGHSATVQSDLYSVGAVMVEGLSGRRPVPGADVDPPVPAQLQSVAARALAADPQQRFASADEMQHALGSSRRHPATTTNVMQPVPDPTTALPATSVLPAPPVPSRHDLDRRWPRYVIPALAAAIVAVLLLLFVVAGGQPTSPSTSSTSQNSGTGQLSTAKGDIQARAIKRLATSLQGGGFPGDHALATSLDSVAAAKRGVARKSAAQQTLNLAGVLLAGGGITDGQFQDTATVLQATGATAPTTTTTTTTTVPVTTPTKPAPGGHQHGPGGDKGGPGG